MGTEDAVKLSKSTNENLSLRQKYCSKSGLTAQEHNEEEEETGVTGQVKKSSENDLISRLEGLKIGTPLSETKDILLTRGKIDAKSQSALHRVLPYNNERQHFIGNHGNTDGELTSKGPVNKTFLEQRQSLLSSRPLSEVRRANLQNDRLSVNAVRNSVAHNQGGLHFKLHPSQIPQHNFVYGVDSRCRYWAHQNQHGRLPQSSIDGPGKKGKDEVDGIWDRGMDTRLVFNREYDLDVDGDGMLGKANWEDMIPMMEIDELQDKNESKHGTLHNGVVAEIYQTLAPSNHGNVNAVLNGRQSNVEYTGCVPAQTGTYVMSSPNRAMTGSPSGSDVSTVYSASSPYSNKETNSPFHNKETGFHMEEVTKYNPSPGRCEEVSCVEDSEYSNHGSVSSAKSQTYSDINSPTQGQEVRGDQTRMETDLLKTSSHHDNLKRFTEDNGVNFTYRPKSENTQKHDEYQAANQPYRNVNVHHLINRKQVATIDLTQTSFPEKPEVFDEIGRDFEGDSLLHSCIIADVKTEDIIKVVDALMCVGLLNSILDNQNKMLRTALFLAVMYNRFEVAQILLRFGANPNLQGKVLGINDNYELRGALHLIVEQGDAALDMLQLFLDCPNTDIDIHSESDRVTPLQVALISHCTIPGRKSVNCTQTIKLLIESGANLEKIEDRSSKTPVMMAIDTRDFELVKMFLNCVKDHELVRSLLECVTRGGDTPLHLAAGADMPRDNKTKLIRMLVNKGANTSKENNIKQVPQDMTSSDLWKAALKTH